MEIDRFLKNIVVWGSFIIPFIPFFFFSNTFFPYIVGKNFGFRIIVLIILAAWLTLIYRNKEYRPKYSPILGSILIFGVIIGLADLFGHYPYKSFWSNYERMEGYVTILHLISYFIVVASTLTREKLWDVFLKTSIVVSLLTSFYGLFQLAGKITISQGGVRLDGPFGNAAYMAVYILIHIFLILFYWLQSKNKNRNWIYGPMFVLEIFVLYQTATRGALLGLIGGLFLSGLLLLFGERENKHIRKVAISFIVAMLVIVGGFFLIKNTEFVRSSEVLNRFASISLEDKTTKSRFMIWSMAFEGFKESPILGWGQENFNYVFNKYYNPALFDQEQWFDRAHNVFFDWLIAGGILGLLSYLSIFAAALYMLWRGDEFNIREKSILTGLFAAYFFHNFFVFDNLMSFILFFTLVGYIHARKVGDKKPILYTLQLSGWQKVSASMITIVIIIGAFYATVAKPITANMLLFSTFTYNQDDPERILSFEKAHDLETFANSEIAEQAFNGAQNIIFSAAKEEVKIANAELTERYLKEEIEKTPDNTRYLLFLGSFYNRVQRYDDAIHYLTEALKSSPRKQSIMIELASAYMAKGEKEKAVQLFKEAYNADTSFKDLQAVYVSGLLYSGQTELAEELLKDADEAVYKNGRIARAYGSNGNTDRAIEILENNVQKGYTTSEEDYYYLASLYVLLERDTDAVRVIEMGIEKELLNEVQARGIIGEIEKGNNPFVSE